jgi:class 3 adenylate cyclase
MFSLSRHWREISTSTIPDHIQGALREWHSLTNRVVYLGVIYWIVIYGAGLLFAATQIFFFESTDYLVRAIWLFWPNYGAAVAVAGGFFYLKFYKSYALAQENQMRLALLFMAAAALLLFWAAWLTPIWLPFGLLNLPLLQTFIALRDSKRFGPSQIITATIIIASGFFGTAKQILIGAPIPLGSYIVVWGSPVIIIMLLAFTIVVVYYLRHEADETKEYISFERQRSEKLLLNIMPAEVAQELKDHGRTTPRRIESATIIFTDFVGFTKIAEVMAPEDLVKELDLCFSYFDSVCEKYNLEKLKTIGDAFMCAGGLPKANTTHPFDAALAALEIRQFMHQMKEIRREKNLPYWELRLGMHTGPVVAGVVGEKKFAYDIWGDTVNTASRMESAGAAEQINISASTAAHLEKYFRITARGHIAAKNKGEIEMYFLEGLLPAYAKDREGRVPNAAFAEAIQDVSQCRLSASAP